MNTQMIKMEGRNADRFPVILNPHTIDMLILPAQLLLSRGIDTGLTDSEIIGEWDADTIDKPMTLKMFHTASRNTKFIYRCAHKLRADLENILSTGTFTMLKCTSGGENGDNVALVNLNNVHQMRWSMQKRRLYFDFVWGGKQFLQALDIDDLKSDIERVEQGWHDNFSFMHPETQPEGYRRKTKHNPRKLVNKVILPPTQLETQPA